MHTDNPKPPEPNNLSIILKIHIDIFRKHVSKINFVSF